MQVDFIRNSARTAYSFTFVFRCVLDVRCLGCGGSQMLLPNLRHFLYYSIKLQNDLMITYLLRLGDDQCA